MVVDFDEDGHLDLAVTNFVYGEDLRIYSNRGDGTFELSEISGPIMILTNSIDSVDFDNDGDSDIAVLTPDGYMFLENRGERTWAAGDFFPIDRNGGFVHPIVSELDGDPHAEIVAETGFRVQVFEDALESGDVSLELRSRRVFNYVDLESADLDGDGLDVDLDGDLELFTTTGFLIHDGAPGFATDDSMIDAGLLPFYWPNPVAAADFNNDGRPDLPRWPGTPSGFI